MIIDTIKASYILLEKSFISTPNKRQSRGPKTHSCSKAIPSNVSLKKYTESQDKSLSKTCILILSVLINDDSESRITDRSDVYSCNSVIVDTSNWEGDIITANNSAAFIKAKTEQS